MELLEFITYCTIKDLIVTHERLDNEWLADKANKQTLIIENNNFLANITYSQVAGEYNILHTLLSRVTARSDEPIEPSDFKTIISKFA